MKMNNDFHLYWEELFPILRITGEGTRKFLHGQTTSDIYLKNDGDLFQTCWLDPTGRLRGLLELRLDNSGADIIILAGDINDLRSSLEKVIFPLDKVQLQNTKSIKRILFFSGNDSDQFEEILWQLEDEPLPRKNYEFNKASQCEYNLWRIRKGIIQGNEGVNRDANPLELGLLYLIDLDKGCYIGQETIAKLSRSGHLKQQLRFWKSDSNVLVGEKFTAPHGIEENKKSAGEIISSMSDLNGNSYGFVLVKRSGLGQNKLVSIDDKKVIEVFLPQRFKAF